MGIHYIRTSLFSIPLTKLRRLMEYCLDLLCTDPYSTKYKLVAIITDVGQYRLYRPVRTGEQVSTRSFLKINFTNKGIDAINLGNILHHKKVTANIPAYFREATPLICYKYIKPIGPNIFNYRRVLQDFDVGTCSEKLPICTCSTSNFIYAPLNHVITGDLSIVENDALRDLLSKGPKYREAKAFTWQQNLDNIMHSVEEHARKWAKREHATADSLSEWVKAIRTLIKRRIFVLRRTFNNKPKSVFNHKAVAKCLSSLHDKYVIVPTDKAANNIVFVCKRYYYECLLSELGYKDNNQKSAYTPTNLNKKEVIDNHTTALMSFGLEIKEQNSELPLLYWIPKLHKRPYKQRFIAGSSKCSTKPLSALLTTLLGKIKDNLHSYCDTIYERSGMNQMWILKNSKELLEKLSISQFTHISSIKTFDFSTLYTTIPHDQLKSRLKDLVYSVFTGKNGKRKYRYLVVNGDWCYFVRDHSDAEHKYSERNIVDMINFLIDNIFVVFGHVVFQQTVGVPMGTNCAPLLADLFLYSYEAEFMQKIRKSKDKNLVRSFNFTFRYIDDVLSVNNCMFADYLDEIYPPELEIKDTTESATTASYLDIRLIRETSGRLNTELYDKRDDFSFPIVNFPFLCSNIPSSPAYGVYVSQLIRYARSCSKYDQFVTRSRQLTLKLLNQGYVLPRIMAAFRKFYGRHHPIVDKYNIAVSHMVRDICM